MNCLELLNQFAEYANYDKKQKSFNLGNMEFYLHEICKKIEFLLSEYDASGVLSLTYAKKRYFSLLKDVRINLYNAILNPESFEEEQKIVSMFSGEKAVEAISDLKSRIAKLSIKISKGHFIGENDQFDEEMEECIVQVVETIGKLHTRMFKKGKGNIAIKNVDTKIHIFETLADCLLHLEKAEDGMYLCFIRACNTADCFFGFFIKSNGTILSIDDKVNESFIGQHTVSRNGRWVESKADFIFPYDYIFSYSGHDYKGYAEKYVIDEEKLELYNLDNKAFLPVLIAIVFILLRYDGKEIQMDLSYLDSFIPANREIIESNQLMVIGDSDIVSSHSRITANFDVNDVLAGNYDYLPPANNQILVDIWGAGFKIDPTRLFSSNNVKCIANKSDEYISEFISDAYGMESQMYVAVRKQLAEYMNEKITECWEKNGKTEAVIEWYHKALLENRDALYRLFIQTEKDIADQKYPKLSIDTYGRTQPANPSLIPIYVQNRFASVFGDQCWQHVINCVRDPNNQSEDVYYDPDNGNKCNKWFIVYPNNWKQIEALTGCTCPDLVKGWELDRTCTGNPLLNLTDPVECVGTPFEAKSFAAKKYGRETVYRFCFAFGFSKRGWKKICKDLS